KLLTRPALMAQGLGWVARLAGARVPVLFRHGVREAEGEGLLRTVVIGPVDSTGAHVDGRQTRYAVATLVVGHGLVPGAEVPRLLRAAMRYDRTLGGHIPVLDPDGRTGMAGLYACGDGAGIRGAAVAVSSGRLAGLAAARDGGVLGQERFAALAEPSRTALARLQSFSGAMAAMMSLRPGQVAAITADTVVCRCEDVTRAEIEAAIDTGATDVNQLKHFTRCGMGPCQGRMCGDVAAELLAVKTGATRESVGQWTARPPLRPVPMADLMGRFDYADIPIPRPAPL
ncbi:MAG: (2Fe-2S)-binding protein, partial [Alsobacter sp.]